MTQEDFSESHFSRICRSVWTWTRSATPPNDTFLRGEMQQLSLFDHVELPQPKLPVEYPILDVSSPMAMLFEPELSSPKVPVAAPLPRDLVLPPSLSNESLPDGPTKHDQGKPKLGLLWVEPLGRALTQVVRVLEYGMRKYPGKAGRWFDVSDGFERYKHAALRHLVATWEGEFSDPESGLPHLAHAACNCLFSLAIELKR